MIKKLLIASCAIILLLCPVLLRAVPAYPYPVKVIQPDGSSVMICQHGDEFFNSLSTEDGYTVVLNNEGYYVYASLENNSLVPSAYVAKDVTSRTADEKSFLSKIGKSLTVAVEVSRAKTLRAAANAGYQKNALLNQARTSALEHYRGLVILVEYNDREFIRDDANALFTDMVTARNYTGFDSDAGHEDYTGSVRDYFYDNSKGKFDPEFDVVGPVKINYNQTFVNATMNATTIMKAACRAVDSQVDFSNYDSDGDGEVDMVYFIFAGGGSNVADNNQQYLWPHASAFWWFQLDGVSLGRYACSTELYGFEDDGIIDGIGTICHEFSHVLGLPDLYDVDYAGSGGNSFHPGLWSVMAGGSYLNMSRTPCGYTLYERYASGWITPALIEEEGEHTLPPLGVSEEGFRINSAVEEEFFLLENRQQEGWDRYLPGHGMLVFRVDSTDTDIWVSNSVNNVPLRQCFELLRANPAATNYVSDPYPGKSEITYLSGNGALASWDGSETPVSVFNIKENEGVITFNTGSMAEQVYLEDFENMRVTTGDVTDIEGSFSHWSLKKSLVQEPSNNQGRGNRTVSMVKGAELQTTIPMDAQVKSASFMFWNPTTKDAEVGLKYTKKGNFWTAATAYCGTSLVTVPARESALIKFYIDSATSATYRITLSEGSTTAKCYLDDFKLNYAPKTGTGISHHIVNDDSWNVYCQDGLVQVTADDVSSSEVRLYSADGVLIACEKLQDGKAEILLPRRGLYIINCDGKTAKVIY